MTKGIKFLLIFIFLSLPFWWGINIFQENLEKFFYAQISQPLEEMTFVKIPPKKPRPELKVKSAISLKIGKNREKILFLKNPEEILPIASLTKLMTAYVVLEDYENYNFSKIITVSEKAAGQENVPPIKDVNLTEGEKANVEKLLNLMLVYSSNDAAFALAQVKGVDVFVDKMNQKANELELHNTHFINPTGLDPENLTFGEETDYFFNYSTVKDLAKLTKYILNKFPLIFEISSTEPAYPIKNGFSDLSLSQDINIIGGKTGYTDEAGGCMILVLEKGNYFINIILGANGTEGRISEMKKLIDWLDI